MPVSMSVRNTTSPVYSSRNSRYSIMLLWIEIVHRSVQMNVAMMRLSFFALWMVSSSLTSRVEIARTEYPWSEYFGMATNLRSPFSCMYCLCLVTVGCEIVPTILATSLSDALG